MDTKSKMQDKYMAVNIILGRNMLELEGIDVEVMDKYLFLGQERIKKKGEYVLKVDQDVKGAYFIKKGAIKNYLLGKNGTIKTLGTAGEGAFHGVQFVFHNYPSLYNAVCVEDCKLYFFDKNTLLDIMEKDFKVTLYIIKFFVIQSRMNMIQFEDRCTRNTLQSVCRVLYSICCYEERLNGPKDNVQIQLTHQELADIVSSHYVTINKILSFLKNMNVLDYKYKNIIIKSEHKYKLKEIAFGEDYCD